ncbi:transketolase [Terasakiella sp. SH-1]|uniref:transketolase n=1 Tax=Terasakiella sp. SH-1 TaxID=2560057 RepID=UPI0010736096|nr:transketolase [Terasakiella sp. SH-1]
MSSSQTSHPSNVSLEERAYNIRRYALRMGEVQGQGYVGQALGFADVLATTYFHAIKNRPEDPLWEGRDRVYLSIGHYAIALYAALIEAGVLPEEELETYGSDDSRLPMSGMAAYTPGMEITGGSLGHGLGIAVGACMGLKLKKADNFIYNLLSDGELGEGSTWEAAMAASHHKLDNLIAIVDFNNLQADGASTEIMSSEPVDAKFESFGWYTQRVDGNDMEALVQAFDNARNHTEEKPRVIICDTLVGKGVPFLEQRDKNHFIRVEADEWQLALEALDNGRANQ